MKSFKEFSVKDLAVKVGKAAKDVYARYRALPTTFPSPILILSGILLALGLTGIFVFAYGLQTELWLCLASAAVMALCVSLCTSRWQTFALFGAVSLICALVFTFMLRNGEESVRGLEWAADNLKAFLTGKEKEVYPEISAFGAVLASLLAGFIGGFSAGRRQLWLSLPATAVLIFCLWKLKLTVSVPFTALAVFALILIELAAYQFPFLRSHKGFTLDRMLILSLPAALILVGACLWNATVTTNYYRSVSLARKVHYTQDMLATHAGKFEPRVPFSLARTGSRYFVYRLGGPITPDGTIVLAEVESRQEVALKGAVFNEYTGNNWKDTTHSRRYALNSSNRDKQKEVFDLDVMDENLFVPYVSTEVTVTVPRTQSHSALFVPFRVDSLKIDGFMSLYPFFNDKGEVFSGRNVEKDIRYTAEARLPMFDTVSFRRIWESQAVKTESNTEKIEKIRSLYTDLPDTVPESIYTLARDITADSVNELEAALAIRQYLAENCSYRLDVEEPDPEEDFVVQFLESGEGYCSYYASAMAVLARAAGLPSRYVEGFNLDAKGQLTSHYYLTGADSHAWAEVYVQGLGWVPMDPLVVETDESQSAQNYTNNGLSTAPQEEYDPYENYEAQLEQMEELNVMKPVSLWQRFLVLWILLIVIALAAVLIVIFHPDLRRYRASRQDLRSSMRWEYEEIVRILSCMSFPLEDGETLTHYLERVSPWLKGIAPVLEETVKQVSRFSYTSAKPSLSDLRKLEHAHTDVKRYSRRSLGLWNYLRYILLRLPRGQKRK